MRQNNQPLVNTANAALQPVLVNELNEICIRADILRLDKIHPIVSGNKWFKLKYYLQEAIQNKHETILSFGGAWSNHIIATAYVANKYGLNSIGIIRGEKPRQLSQTLQAASAYGMQLEFISRSDYAAKEDKQFIDDLNNRYGKVYIIPEGGAGENGVKGSCEILPLTDQSKYSHIMCCIGTGTMYAGLVLSSSLAQEMIGIAVLKGLEKQQIKFMDSLQNNKKLSYCRVIHGYHFGGYAKYTPELLRFMNAFYEKTGIPTDFVYTGKLLYAFADLVEKKYFPSGSHILVIHSGGLQGNLSLPDKTLFF